MSHKLRVFKWVDGILKHREYAFATKHEAINHFKNNPDLNADMAKIVDQDETVVHEIVPSTVSAETYA